MAFLNDPRVLFAAERTLLAWVRTAIALMGLGFVVAKFGLYLHLIAGHEPSPRQEMFALATGVAMVLARGGHLRGRGRAVPAHPRRARPRPRSRAATRRTSPP